MLRGQIKHVRTRIQVLKLALPASTMDDRAFAAVGSELRSKTIELDALKADLKRVQIEARVEASQRHLRRHKANRSFLGKALFRIARAAEA